MKALLNYFGRTTEMLNKDIWELQYLGRQNLRARIYHVLRILTLTWQGLRRNMIPVQAAALTFYSLIGIGPLIALAIMLSGFALDNGNEEIIIDGIARGIAFAAPQIALDLDGDGAGVAQLDPQVLDLINNFSQAAQSGTVGAVGLLTLAFIGLQVLSSIESSFNTLWGVARGRKWSERIVVYWTFVSLGAVLGTISLTLLTFRAVSSWLATRLPFFGEFAATLFLSLTPILTFGLATLLLAVFFRFIPNTKVEWKPAFIGSVIVVLALHLYNMLSFLYVQRVVDTNSLYGSVGIIVVLMLGLYIFWLLILLGGQITYAVQNADFLTNENAWQLTSARTREVVSLGILLQVAKRFQTHSAPIRSSELHKALRVPSHVLNACLDLLCQLSYLYPVQGATADEVRDRAFQPGRPIESITLGSFKQDFECFGNNEGASLLADSDPRLSRYLEGVVCLVGCEDAKTKLSDLV